jgi:hypothetical protein
VYELGATKLSFFFNSGPKKALSLSLAVKCDQQTHKNDVSNYGINLKINIQHSSITILPFVLAGKFPHKSEAVFAAFEGGFYGFGLWEVKF